MNRDRLARQILESLKGGRGLSARLIIAVCLRLILSRLRDKFHLDAFPSTKTVPISNNPRTSLIYDTVLTRLTFREKYKPKIPSPKPTTDIDT